MTLPTHPPILSWEISRGLDWEIGRTIADRDKVTGELSDFDEMDEDFDEEDFDDEFDDDFEEELEDEYEIEADDSMLGPEFQTTSVGAGTGVDEEIDEEFESDEEEASEEETAEE